MLFESHPYLSSADPALQDTGALAAAEYDRLRSRMGTLPSVFWAGRRLYRSWTVHQCWCSTVEAFSFLVLVFCLSRVSRVCSPSSFFPKIAKHLWGRGSLLFDVHTLLFFALVFRRLDGCA